MSAFGVLGGSFDPVHRGHLTLAAGALTAFGLDRVLLMPCADPPHKPLRTLAARYHRLEMLNLAVEGWGGLCVSTYEIARGGVHYTIDTLRSMRDASRGRHPVFLLGSDALSEVGSWRHFAELLAEFDFGVTMRPEVDRTSGTAAWPAGVADRLVPPADLPDATTGAGGRVFSVPIEALPISSSLVRSRVEAGQTIGDLVPPRVARYIQRHGVYVEEARR